jgi:hypothetical protein
VPQAGRERPWKTTYIERVNTTLASGAIVAWGKHARSPKAWRTISGPSGILSTTTVSRGSTVLSLLLYDYRVMVGCMSNTKAQHGMMIGRKEFLAPLC